MANISQIQVGSITYDICDATARDSISSFIEYNNTDSSISVSSILALNTDLFSWTDTAYMYKWANRIMFANIAVKNTQDIYVNAEGGVNTRLIGTLAVGYRPCSTINVYSSSLWAPFGYIRSDNGQWLLSGANARGSAWYITAASSQEHFQFRTLYLLQ